MGEDTVVGRPLGTFAQRKKRAADGHVKEDFGNSEEFWVEGDAAPEVALGTGTGSASSTSVGVPAAGSRVFFDDNNNYLQTEDAKNVPMGRPVLPDVGRAPGFAGSAFGVDKSRTTQHPLANFHFGSFWLNISFGFLISMT